MSLMTIILIAVVFVMLAVAARQMKLPYAVPVLVAVFAIYLTFEITDFMFFSSTESKGEKQVSPDVVLPPEPEPEPEPAPEPEPEPEPEIEVEPAELIAVAEPEPVEEEEPGPPIVVRKFLICRDVNEKAREVIRPADKFPGDVGKLFCFTAFKSVALRDSIFHIWYYNDREINRVAMEIERGNFFRVWSWKTILPQWTGEWYVSVVSSDGEELGRKEFRIIPVPGEESAVTDTLSTDSL
jgi:hypothetical protein